MRCQRRILHIRWHDYIPNNEVLRRTGLLAASSIVRKRRLGLLRRPAAGRRPIVLATNRKGGKLRLNASRDNDLNNNVVIFSHRQINNKKGLKMLRTFSDITDHLWIVSYFFSMLQ